MVLLSVNVNKIATLRNSRGGNHPNVNKVVNDLLAMGVKGITVHPRPDERHIKKTDVVEIAQSLKDQDAELNIEGFPSNDFLEMILSVRPQQATLVPDPPDVLTSNAGWALAENLEFLGGVVKDLQRAEVRCSLFVDPFTYNESEHQALIQINPARVELYTEKFAKDYGTDQQQVTTNTYAHCARKINELGIAINAGHDLNQENLATLAKAIPQLQEVSIGHALICEALYHGLAHTIDSYQKILGHQTTH